MSAVLSSRGLGKLDRELTHIELFDQYAHGHIDALQLAAALKLCGYTPDPQIEMEHYQQARDCIMLFNLKKDLEQIHYEVTGDDKPSK